MSCAGLPADEVRQRKKSKRHPNHRLVKIHRSYTVEEIAKVLGVHRNTVREWIRRGLQSIDNKRPLLVHGLDLIVFLQARRVKRKHRCQPGEIYCVRCRAPRQPAGQMAEYRPLSTTLGSLIGICPSCESMMYRRVNPAKLEQTRGNLEITMAVAQRHIGDSSEVIVISDFSEGQ